MSSSIWTLAILQPSAFELAELGPIIAEVVRAHLERGTFEFRDAAITLWSYATLDGALPFRRHSLDERLAIPFASAIAAMVGPMQKLQYDNMHSRLVHGRQGASLVPPHRRGISVCIQGLLSKLMCAPTPGHSRLPARPRATCPWRSGPPPRCASTG